mmetsp:Transcript_23914/g.34403  ORF Transcript_23914/g.34403 Transcript_23914/m.34403 type:complete len:94 (-) Transcript_23914:4368-4649(-)
MVAAEPVECLIDTGAATATREDVVKAASLPKYDNPRTNGLAVGEEIVLSPGVTKATITLQGELFETTMRIFKHLSHDVYRGFDLLKKHGDYRL